MSTVEVDSVTQGYPMIATRLKFSALDHGRGLTLQEFDDADRAPGFQYEIIEGRLYVSPEANVPEQLLEAWLRDKLVHYKALNPEIIGLVATKGRVFVSSREEATVPEPDLAIFAPFPRRPFREHRWQDLDAFIVIEVLVDGDIAKDLQRNPKLYGRLKRIREYWVLNGSVSPDEPTLIVHTRSGRRWSVTHYPFGSTYATKLLPGFELAIDPNA